MDHHYEDIFAFLQTNHAFRGIREEGLLELIDLITESHYKEGEYISHEGEIAEHLHVVREGHVEILKENKGDAHSHIIASLSIGDTIGELSLIENSPHAARSASIKSITPSHLYTFSNDDLHSTKVEPDVYNILVANLAKVVCRRLRISNEAKTGGSD